MGGTEREYVREAFDSNWIAPVGPNIDAFEDELSRYTGAPHALALSSGTAALHLALILLDVQANEPVICQSMTFAASANPISYLNATPIFVDSEPRTWNMDPELLEKAINDCLKGKVENLPACRPKAIIAVHLYGMPAEMDRINYIAEKYDIPVVEDAAEALGSRFDGRPCGNIGTLGVLSFNGNKIITTSGGGALLSNNPEMIERARFLSTQARDSAPHYQHSSIGYNYRMSNVLAGIGRGQMDVLNRRVEQRRAINKWYRNVFQHHDGIEFLTEPDSRFTSNYWLTTVLIDEEKAGFSREDLRLAFQEKNIESRPLWKPMHMQPVYADAAFYGSGVSEALFEKGLCLPSGSNMGEEELYRIAGVIKVMVKG